MNNHLHNKKIILRRIITGFGALALFTTLPLSANAAPNFWLNINNETASEETSEEMHVEHITPPEKLLDSEKLDSEKHETNQEEETDYGTLYLQKGQNANPIDTPWVAYIQTRSTDDDGGQNLGCTGALISPYWVITARHCVNNNPKNVNVAFGAMRLGNKAISQYILHPDTDIALLKLATPASGIEPITVAATQALEGQRASAYGWGGSFSQLQAGVQRIEKQCSINIEGVGISKFRAICPPKENSVLAYKTTSIVGMPEPGDSGGPLVVDNKLVGTLLGGSQVGSYYIKLVDIKDFIETTTGIILGKKTSAIYEYPYESRVGRIFGQTRVDTSLALFSAAKYPGQSIILATGQMAPDALSSAALVGATSAPILLTTKEYVENHVLDAILKSGKKQLFVIGGQVRFTPEQEDALERAQIDIQRVAGPARYETAEQVAKLSQSIASDLENLDIFLVDSGYDDNIPDALAIGPIVAKKHGVILYTNRFDLPQSTANTIKELTAKAKKDRKKVNFYAIGGWAKGAAAKAGIIENPMQWNIDTLDALAGADRYGTAAQVVTRLGKDFKQYLIASGQNFADGLAACGYAHYVNAGIMLSMPSVLPPSTLGLIKQNSNMPYTMIGGTLAISRNVANEVGEQLAR